MGIGFGGGTGDGGKGLAGGDGSGAGGIGSGLGVGTGGTGGIGCGGKGSTDELTSVKQAASLGMALVTVASMTSPPRRLTINRRFASIRRLTASQLDHPSPRAASTPG